MGYGPRSANQGAWTGQSQDPSLIRTSLTDKVLGKGSQESLSDVQEHRIQLGHGRMEGSLVRSRGEVVGQSVCLKGVYNYLFGRDDLMWNSEDNLWKLVLFSYHVGLRD